MPIKGLEAVRGMCTSSFAGSQGTASMSSQCPLACVLLHLTARHCQACTDQPILSDKCHTCPKLAVVTAEHALMQELIARALTLAAFTFVVHRPASCNLIF